MALFKRERKLRAVPSDDPGFAQVIASLDTAPGPARDARAKQVAAEQRAEGTECYVYDGEDGNPAAAVVVRPAGDGVVEVWLGVDPALRSFGLGEQVWQLALARARKLKATRIRSYATQPEGLSFLQGHGFEATRTDGSEDASYRVEAELALP